MNDQNPNPPQDMWPDDDPRPAQPIQQPPVPPMAATPPPPSTFEPHTAKKSSAMAWSVAAAVLVIATGVAGYYIWNKTSGDELVQEEVGDTQNDEVSQPTSDPVEWQSRQTISSLKLLDPNQGEAFRPEVAKYYKLGKFIEGQYKDADLVALTLPPIGPGHGDYYYRFAKAGDGKLTLLANHSAELFDGDGLDRARFSVDSNFRISSLAYPSRIENPQDSDQPLIQESGFMDVWFNAAEVKKVFTDSKWGDVYTSRLVPTALGEPSKDSDFDTLGFYLEAPDGTARFYNIEIPFTSKSGIPSVTWSDNQRNTEEYKSADVGGCGIQNFAAVVPVSVTADLEKGGKASNGDDIWVAKNNVNNGYLKALHEATQPQMEYKDFISRGNMFFWKDFLGRTIKFQNVKNIPQAECGKPVIYLYPEKTTQVSVKVAPQGGFTYTEPAYNNGWDVLANPEGVLKEIKSGKTYPYLFWEGKGGIYTAPTKGFVVAGDKVSALLSEKLTMHGLNQKEIADFKEFWLPRMQGAPYYFVTFLGNVEMNRIAPLTISPKPDTVIRILMDYTPLQQPMKVEGYTVKTPERKGFTVVEWGGVLK